MVFFTGFRRVNHNVIEVGRGVTAKPTLKDLINKALEGCRSAKKAKGRN